MKRSRLTNRFPLYTDSLCISILGKRNLDWYTDEVRKEYFYEYLDNKIVAGISRDRVRELLLMQIEFSKYEVDFNSEIRLIIQDKNTKERYGGITIYHLNKNNDIELAYWINPKYQGKGIATEALNALIDVLYNIISKYSHIILRIQQSNTKSIQLAERCGFKLKEVDNGNKIYELKRKE